MTIQKEQDEFVDEMAHKLAQPIIDKFDSHWEKLMLAEIEAFGTTTRTVEMYNDFYSKWTQARERINYGNKSTPSTIRH